MLLRYLLLLIGLLVVLVDFTQGKDYSVPDSIATEVSETRYKEVRDLTYALTKDLKDEEMIYRAIVKWISLNIEYKLTNSKDGNEVIKRGVAKCAGYSLLVHEMCFHAGIQSRIVEGDAKPGPSDVGKKLNFNDHAWNAVKIKGTWYLSDVTWVTSSSDIVTGDFTYGFDEQYFLQTPEESVKSGHYAKDPEKMFLEKKCSKCKYKSEPRCYAAYFKKGKNVIDQEKVRGVIGRSLTISVPKSDTLDYGQFRITYLNGKDWFSTSPKWVKEKNGVVKIKFDLKKVSYEPLFLKYKDQTYLGMRKR